MPASSTRIDHGPHIELDEIVEQFEDAWNESSNVDVSSFFPGADHPDFAVISLELLCVDLERRWKNGRPKSVERYQKEFPSLLEDRDCLERLAFEEYRLAAARGAVAQPDQFARRYGIRTSHWPRQKQPSEGHGELARRALADGVADEMGRIANIPGALPRPGEEFLNFTVVEELGKCQFGSVFLARQRDLSDRLVVIKVTSNLWSESDRLARLQHSNIVPIYSVHEHEGYQAVCMPFLGRRTLAALLTDATSTDERNRNCTKNWLSHWLVPNAASSATQEHLSWLQTLGHERLCAWIVLRIAKGLGHAHDRGILHRDLKPANILMTDEFQPMILDFNLSEDAVVGGKSSLLIGGTLPYMAPEHLLAVISEGNVDERSDVYALGVILFELLTGRRRFSNQSDSTINTLSYLINERYDVVPEVRQHDPQLSRDIEAIVLRCLASKPDERYQSAHELKEDLDRHLCELPLKHAPNRSVRERTSKWIRRHPKLTSSSAVGAICGVLLVTLCCVAWVRGRQNAELLAAQTLRRFHAAETRALAPLSVGITDPRVLELGLAEAEQAIGLYKPGRQHDWRAQPQFRLLTPSQQQALTASLSRLETLAQRAQALPLSGSRPGDRLVLDDALANVIQQIMDGEYEIARRTLAAQVEEEPSDFLLWFLLGNCALELGDGLDADSCFTSCIALLPEFHASYFLRGRCRLLMGRFEHGASDFTRALKLEPSLTSAYVNRGLARSRQGRHGEAIADFSQAIRAGRDDALVYLLRANSHEALGANQDAARDRKLGMAKTPSTIDGWLQRSAVNRKTDPERALRDLDQALTLKPGSSQAIQNKVALLSQLQRNAEAEALLSQHLDRHPRDTAAMMARGILRARLGSREAALEDARRGLALSDAAITHLRMARLLAHTSNGQSGDVELAAFHLRKALGKSPQFVELIDADPDLQMIRSSLAVSAVIDDARRLRGAASPTPVDN